MFDSLPFGGGVSVGLQGAAGASKWASVKNENKMLNIVIIAAAGAVTVALRQDKDLDGPHTAAKLLEIERVHRKTDVGQLIGAGPATVKDLFVGDTTVDNENPLASYSTATGSSPVAAVSDVILVRVRPHDLDVENGFNCVECTVTGNVLAVLFVPESPVYKGADSVGVLDA